MSISKWGYKPEKCDGDFCCNDCDFCPKAYEDDEPEMKREEDTDG